MTSAAAQNPRPEFNQVRDFLLDVARLALMSGSSSHRVENLLVRIGKTWGYEVEAAAIPTVVWITIRKEKQQILELTRVKNWGVDLTKLTRLSYLVDQIDQDKIPFNEAQTKLVNIQLERSPYSFLVCLIAGAASSASIEYFYQGQAHEVVLAAILGVVVFLINGYSSDYENRRVVSDFFAGLIVGILALGLKYLFTDIEPTRLIVAGLIVPVPGLIFVNAVHEVANKNLASGSARLLEAAIVGLSLAFGVACAIGLHGIVGGR